MKYPGFRNSKSGFFIKILMKRIIVVLILVVTAAAIVTIVFKVKANKSPEVIVLEAGRLKTVAKAERASEFAYKEYKQAIIYCDSAMTEWQNQNKRFFLFRNYDKATKLANKSISFSRQAIETAKENSSKTATGLNKRISETENKISYFKKNFSNFPMTTKQHNDAATSSLLCSEGVLAFKKSDYITCKSKLDSANILISGLIDYYENLMKEYFVSYSKWKKMLDETILYSKKHSTTVVIVDKIARELTIYKNGKEIDQFAIELGPNWIGDKQKQGDKSTPEGQYKIVRKEQDGQTKYYKALLLNYPNDEDKSRFLSNKKSGIINKDAQIGNQIKIHGNGGKGVDWTSGCIALKNSEMNAVYNQCGVGTMVTIVGSTRPLNELLSNNSENK